MVYFDNILEFLGAAQFEAFSLRFNLCFGTSTRDLASLFKLQGTRVGDGSSEDCKSSILIQSSKNPFKQLDLGDELPFIELALGYNHILQVWKTNIIWSTFFLVENHSPVNQNKGGSHMKMSHWATCWHIFEKTLLTADVIFIFHGWNIYDTTVVKNSFWIIFERSTLLTFLKSAAT